ncbi:pantoate kinase [Methanofollis fontis]|uniref:Pantoate kinase n=1 Tax=Methanofollis fontis TaxID=2052832 RepID=A0A483CTA2_9EURY|nr:pantoate kinase [Methanofollis fontis]TAJ44573.1 GHMP kinase [Methanofollis fontis]
MVRTAVAFSPGHISGYFRKIAGESPALTGSIGAGIVIDEGVLATASAAERREVVVREVDAGGRVRSESQGSPPLEYAMERLNVRAHVETACRLPIGAGFGLSAAALLASITAIDALLELGLSRAEIAAVAHEAEVVHSTGLGDVSACQGGGIACRETPGPGGRITRIPSDQEIWAVSFGPLPTPDVIGSAEHLERVAAAFPTGCPTDLEGFFSRSRAFAEASGLVTADVRSALEACDAGGVLASMTMLGRGVFATGDGAREVLAPFTEPIRLNVAESGFHLLEVRG